MAELPQKRKQLLLTNFFPSATVAHSSLAAAPALADASNNLHQPTGSTSDAQAETPSIRAEKLSTTELEACSPNCTSSLWRDDATQNPPRRKRFRSQEYSSIWKPPSTTTRSYSENIVHGILRRSFFQTPVLSPPITYKESARRNSQYVLAMAWDAHGMLLAVSHGIGLISVFEGKPMNSSLLTWRVDDRRKVVALAFGPKSREDELIVAVQYVAILYRHVPLYFLRHLLSNFQRPAVSTSV